MLFNYLFENDLIFYSIFTGTVGFIGYSLCKSIWDNSGSTSDFDYLNTDLNTTSNVYSDVGTHSIPGSVSTATTVLPIPPVNVEIVPNPDLTAKIIDTIVVGYDYIDRAHAIADMLGLAFI